MAIAAAGVAAGATLLTDRMTAMPKQLIKQRLIPIYEKVFRYSAVEVEFNRRKGNLSGVAINPDGTGVRHTGEKFIVSEDGAWVIPLDSKQQAAPNWNRSERYAASQFNLEP